MSRSVLLVPTSNTIGNVRFDFIFRAFDGAGHLTPVTGSPFQSRGDGGSTVAPSPDGRFLFVADGAGNRVSSLRTELVPGRPGAYVLGSSPFANAPVTWTAISESRQPFHPFPSLPNPFLPAIKTILQSAAAGGAISTDFRGS